MATSREGLVNFPLAPCQLVKLRQFYYAIGNDPARNIFYRDDSSEFEKVKLMEPHSWRHTTFDPAFEQALCTESARDRPLRVLCLACGDLRNILFSLSADDTNGDVEIVANDYDIHVLARNILLLDCIFDNDISDEDGVDEAIFSIWFSTGLRSEQRNFLDRKLRQLILRAKHPSLSPSQSQRGWNSKCHEVGLLTSLCDVWKKWLGFFTVEDDHDAHEKETKLKDLWVHTQEMRHIKFTEELTKFALSTNFKLSEAEPGANDSPRLQHRALIKKCQALPFLVHYGTVFEEGVIPSEVKKMWIEEDEMHKLTGVFMPNTAGKTNPEHWSVNPTLFWDEQSYDLHYGTDSVLAFPLIPPSSRRCLVDICFGIFKTWLKIARQKRARIAWIFSGLDCQLLCLNFDPTVLSVHNSSECSTNTRSSGLSETFTNAGTFGKGGLVLIHGLEKSPHLNNCYGVLTGNTPEEGRWGVHLIQMPNGVSVDKPTIRMPKGPVSVKQANLLLLRSSCGLLKRVDEFGWFNVITTSNVADHIGISTILLLCRPLLVRKGTLLTTCFLHKGNHSTAEKYLEASLLGCKPHCWSTVFGFRAIGYESNTVASPACKVSHAGGVIELAFKGRNFLSLVWLATPFNSNIPIAPGSQIRTVLNAFEQNTWENARLHNMDGKVAAILHKLRPSNKPLRYFRSDPERGFLEYMLSTASKSTQREQVTTRAVCIGGIILCTFEVADATLRQTFSSDI